MKELIYIGILALLTPSVTKADCWEEAGRYYNVDPWVLYAIAHVESGLNPLAVNDRNRDGSFDIGLMQINSFWFAELRAFDIGRKELLDPCTNVAIGAWILRQSLDSFDNYWEGVGAYNAGTGRTEERHNLRMAYANRIYGHWINFAGMREQDSN
jgi:soluble lytic murein transglycosylase-like protein